MVLFGQVFKLGGVVIAGLRHQLQLAHCIGQRHTAVLTWTVTEEGFRSLSANSWLLGEQLTGAVVKTVADGRVVHAA